jgi:hypothetical protein
MSSPKLFSKETIEVETIPTLTEEFRSNLAHVLNQAPPGEHYALNLANDQEYNYILQLYHLNGITPDLYPQLFNDLADTRSLHQANGAAAQPEAVAANGLVNANTITAFGQDANQKAAAEALSTVVGGTISTTLFMQVYDNNSNRLLANGVTGPVYGKGEFEYVQAAGDPATNNMKGVYTYAYTPLTGGQPVHGVVHANATERPARDPVVQQPVQKATHQTNPYIRIGLGRGIGNSADVDYWFNQQDYYNKDVTVPVVGYVDFQSNIQTPLQENVNFSANMMVIKQATGGAQPIILHAQQKLIDFMTVSPGTRLNWSMPADSTPATFGQAPWSADTPVYFNFQVAIKTATSGTDFVFASVVSKDVADPDPVDGTAFIKPLQFVWHCLAEGAQITMADGNLRNIEALSGGERVMIRTSGRSLTVRGTTAHPVQPEDKLYQLTDERGHSLILTHHHVVMTPNGTVYAMDLAPGMKVITLDGAVTLTSVAQEEHYNGALWNLELGTWAELEDVREDETTMFANGFMVGDNQMVWRHRQRLVNSLAYRLARLPQAYHEEATRAITKELSPGCLAQIFPRASQGSR